MMNFTQVLSDYLLNQFPWLQGSQLCYEPISRRVYVYCREVCEPQVLFQEAEAIARLDIGVEQFIIKMPRDVIVVIESQPNSKREIL